MTPTLLPGIVLKKTVGFKNLVKFCSDILLELTGFRKISKMHVPYNKKPFSSV